jgi:predicted acetyltransferase
MTVSLRDARHAPQHHAWLERSYANWLGEFARRRVTATEVSQGLDQWFGDRRNIVMLLMRDGLPAGFSMFTRLPLPSPDAFRMQEFYVETEMRRHGVGRAAAQLVFDRFAGQWEVRELRRNVSSVCFWREVVRHYTAGRYDETLVGEEVVQRFFSNGAR